MKKAIGSFDLGKAALYGAVLAAFWTFVFGLYYWVIGWLFGAQAWFIDMNLGIWTTFTLETALSVVWRMFINGLGGAFAGFFVALVYNAVAGMMGGIVINLDDAK
jgi:hypothetical protein